MDIRILLVEDDEHICNTVKTFLSEAGYKIIRKEISFFVDRIANNL